MTMTELQTIIRETYKAAHQRRNEAASEVNDCIYRLDQARLAKANAQKWLERVGAELKTCGYDKAEDYLTRVWPVAAVDERPSNPDAAVAE